METTTNKKRQVDSDAAMPKDKMRVVLFLFVFIR